MTLLQNIMHIHLEQYVKLLEKSPSGEIVHYRCVK